MPPAGSREIYVEFVVQGAYCKATAIDPATGTEATTMGPAGAAQQHALADAAIRKLKYVLAKKSSGA
jgi:hypothetical protein